MSLFKAMRAMLQPAVGCRRSEPSPRRRHPHRRAQRFHPHLEGLEGRALLSNLLVVSTASDAAGHSGTSLRDAVAQANVDAAAGQSDTITFDPSLAGATITLTQGQLELSGAGGGTITVDGSTLSNPIAISGNNASRVFLVDSGVHALLNDLVVTGGNGNSSVAANFGGGIYNSGVLTLTGDSIQNNNVTPPTGLNAGGGGIFNKGTLSVSSATITGNAVNYGSGGGIYNYNGTVTVNNTTISANTLVSGYGAGGAGGGIYSQNGTLTVSNSTFSYNNANGQNGSGGGIYTTYTGTVTNAMRASSGDMSSAMSIHASPERPFEEATKGTRVTLASR